MEKKWNIHKVNSPEVVSSLQNALSIDETIAKLLVLRNITTYEEAKTFFRPGLDMLHDPFLMKGMDVAIERIIKAIANKEKVLIFGDYDVDGTTSVALVYSFFKNYISEIRYYIPDRYAEGYGISFKSIDYAEENNYSLIIALDCGIKANDKIDYANSKNVDFISIGTNDLLQYTCAADRLNPELKKVYNPYNIGFLLQLHHIISSCKKDNNKVKSPQPKANESEVITTMKLTLPFREHLK